MRAWPKQMGLATLQGGDKGGILEQVSLNQTTRGTPLALSGAGKLSEGAALTLLGLASSQNQSVTE